MSGFVVIDVADEVEQQFIGPSEKTEPSPDDPVLSDSVIEMTSLSIKSRDGDAEDRKGDAEDRTRAEEDSETRRRRRERDKKLMRRQQRRFQRRKRRKEMRARLAHAAFTHVEKMETPPIVPSKTDEKSRRASQTEEEVLKRLKRRETIISSLRNAYCPKSNLPCHICCSWGSEHVSSSECPCCGRREGSAAEIEPSSFNFQDALKLRDEQEQKKAKLSNSMTLANWNRLKSQSHVRLLIKAMPAGSVTRLILTKDDTVKYLYFLYRAAAGVDGMQASIRLYVPTAQGFAYLSNEFMRGSATQTKWDPASFSLGDYGIEVKNADIAMLQCHAGNENQSRSIMTSFLRRNLTIRDLTTRRAMEQSKLGILHSCSEVNRPISPQRDSIQSLLVALLTTQALRRNEKLELRLRREKAERREREEFQESLRKKLAEKKANSAMNVALKIFKERKKKSTIVTLHKKASSTRAREREKTRLTLRQTIDNAASTLNPKLSFSLGLSLRRNASCAFAGEKSADGSA